eukprot:3456497-Pyramimonas_sp.AAC.1
MGSRTAHHGLLSVGPRCRQQPPEGVEPSAPALSSGPRRGERACHGDGSPCCQLAPPRLQIFLEA